MLGKSKLKALFDYVAAEFKEYDPGHDILHIKRVYNTAVQIAETKKQKGEKVDMEVVQAASVLHDVFDSKFVSDSSINQAKLVSFLKEKIKMSDEQVQKVLDVALNSSFSKKKSSQTNSVEFKIVQDADRIDALGAIGVARAFSYGGFRKRPFYDEKDKTNEFTTLAHFYHKLLKIFDLLNTPEAKQIAKPRYEFLKKFVEEFEKEAGLD